MEENRYATLLRAIEEERLQEEKYFKSLGEVEHKKEKISNGSLVTPLMLEKGRYTLGERVELILYRTKDNDKNHKFKVGVAAEIFIENKDHRVKCSVSYVRKNQFRVILADKDASLNDFPKSAWYGLELTYDEKPYRVMREAVSKVLKSKSLPMQELRDGISKKDAFEYSLKLNQEVNYPNLNDSQNVAINGLLCAHRIGIIHGPPGTGKTTTIVSLAKSLLQSEKKILVCAPSNNAVDLLASRLSAGGMKVLRIGNVSRVDDIVAHLTLDEQLRSHPDYSQIKKVKIEAQEASKAASAYKRKFGNDERAYRAMMYKESRELRDWARTLEDRIVDDVIQSSQIICATLIGIDSKYTRDLKFGTVIIDEASQALEPECWNAILKAERVFLVGDHLQLPPTVKSKKAMELGLDKTLLHHLADHITHSYLLDVQYRMNDKILSYSNKSFYDGKLSSDSSVAEWTLDRDASPLVLIDTSGCGFDEEFDYKSRSISNVSEYGIIETYLLDNSERFSAYSCGIISPYAQQVRMIRTRIEDQEVLKTWDIQVDTVDGFQGQEKDIICISLVRSNTSSEIGFLKDFRRLNVALTRAKKKLIIVGDFSTLSTYDLYRSLIDHVQEIGEYRSAWEFMSY